MERLNADWIQAVLEGVASETPEEWHRLAMLVRALHSTNKRQWGLEDSCREAGSLETAGRIKLEIDRSNEERTGLMRRIDDQFHTIVGTQKSTLLAFPVSFGDLIDRASVAEIRRSTSAVVTGLASASDASGYYRDLLGAIDNLMVQFWDGSVRLLRAAPRKVYSSDGPSPASGSTLSG